jgi:hypothetical protein
MIQSYAVPEGISKGQAFDEDDDDDEGEGSTSDAGVIAKYPYILSSLVSSSSSSYSGAEATSSSSSAPVASNDSAVEPSPIQSIDANMSTAEWHDKLRVLCNCAEDGFSRDRFG